ncbi:hypothetical protein N7481_001496 [Penicillium waksmanii]|uniref:uncharacterized protein n=1 Tax=Penicillium waksmanii TaxID=69791 RepID=UPI0025476872|nr:uncharacterized protein N7481_001496 [Penicillium waksmanii]KAJ6001087.1 hypothetical protein N7481_001496 [Penicillium waksmanii]
MDIFFGTYNALSIRAALVDILLENYGAAPTDPLYFSIVQSKNRRVTAYLSCFMHGGPSKRRCQALQAGTGPPQVSDLKYLSLSHFTHWVPNKINEYEGMPHYFWVFPQLKQRAQFLEDLVNGIWFILGQ